MFLLSVFGPTLSIVCFPLFSSVCYPTIQCTTTCGPGYQMRAVKCVVGSYGSVMDDTECNAATRPTDTQVRWLFALSHRGPTRSLACLLACLLSCSLCECGRATLRNTWKEMTCVKWRIDKSSLLPRREWQQFSAK